MRCVITLLLFSAINAEFSQPWTLIPEDMTPFCSNKDVCKRNIKAPTLDVAAQSSLIIPSSTIDFLNCCTDCSCGEDCGYRDTCCFPEMNKQQSNERLHQECLVVSTPRVNSRAPSVLMFTSSNALIGNDITNQSSVTCGNVKVATWGSMLPVYSRETRRVYKNHVCAKEHNAADLVNWIPNIYCSYSVIDSDRIAQIAQLAYESFQIGPDCTIFFLPPKDIIQDVKTEICYLDIIGSCNNDSYGHTFVNMTAEQVKTACESGFYSPFIFGKRYANVFCYLCNINSFKATSELHCDAPPQLMGPNLYSMSMVLNTDLFLNDSATHGKPTTDRVLACKRKKNKSIEFTAECSEVLCPTGKVRAPNGTCLFIFSEMAVAKPLITLVLYPRESFNVLDIVITAPIDSWLKSPWSRDWKMFIVYTHETTSELTNITSVNEIVVYMYLHRVNLQVTPAMIVDEMVQTLPKAFQICLSSFHCVSCDQELMKYELDQTFLIQPILPMWYTRLENSSYFRTFTKSEVKSYTKAYIDTNFALSIFQSFNKMFLCNQIELNKTEYDMHEFAAILFYKPANRILFRNEFEVVRDVQGVNKVRICLEDSDFVIETSGCNDTLFTDTPLSKLILGFFAAIFYIYYGP